ncbi:hypothetical protein [Lentzea sp. NPDC092896]|uniref:hypothetical protein n=1 Tax=Lentzea sp. NPDC092896 TaxID=3364127 RepID=UPI00382AFE1D
MISSLSYGIVFARPSTSVTRTHFWARSMPVAAPSTSFVRFRVFRSGTATRRGSNTPPATSGSSGM